MLREPATTGTAVSRAQDACVSRREELLFTLRSFQLFKFIFSCKNETGLLKTVQIMPKCTMYRVKASPKPQGPQEKQSDGLVHVPPEHIFYTYKHIGQQHFPTNIVS